MLLIWKEGHLESITGWLIHLVALTRFEDKWAKCNQAALF